MEIATTHSTTFDLSGIKPTGCYWVEEMVDFVWRRVHTSEGASVGWRLDGVLALAEKLVDPRTFDPCAEYVPQEVRITRVGRFLNLPLSGESTPSVKVAPLQVEILVTGGPDLSPAGPGRDPIPVGQQGWIGASHINLAYNPA